MTLIEKIILILTACIIQVFVVLLLSLWSKRQDRRCNRAFTVYMHQQHMEARESEAKRNGMAKPRPLLPAKLFNEGTEQK